MYEKCKYSKVELYHWPHDQHATVNIILQTLDRQNANKLADGDEEAKGEKSNKNYLLASWEPRVEE